jgi:hypothetical protein
MLKRTLLLVLTLALALNPGQFAYAWGGEGHQAIGEAAARANILSKEARSEVIKLLGNDDLASVAVWLDHVRDAKRNRGPLKDDPEADQFNKDFPTNSEWHFVNLPLGTKEYEENGKFSGPNNIVRQIQYCIEVLEGKQSKMTKPQALRTLVHLVGDVHQPLHVGIGFFKISEPPVKATLVRDPSKVTDSLFNDRGGNQLNYTASQKLHGFWDGNLVDGVIPGNDNYKTIAQVLISKIGHSGSAWASKGNYKTWPGQWATDSVHQANEAYDSRIKYGKVSFENNKPDTIAITLPKDYQATHQTRATDQLAKAAYHLATLLNQINWK